MSKIASKGRQRVSAIFQICNMLYQGKYKLEIWGKAQHESARRPKSDWGKLEGRVKFSRHQNHVARTQMHWHTPNVHCRLRVGQHERL